MKKSLLVVAFAMVAMVSSAQVFVGGALGFNSDKQKDLEYGTTNFYISPEVGYVLSDSWCIGLPISIEFTKTAAQKVLDTKGTTTWSVSPYARWTFYKNGIFSCFLDGVLGFDGVQGGDTNIAVYVAPGVALSVTENVSLVSRIGSIGWTNVVEVNGLRYRGNHFGLNANASVASVGVYYTF
ncbi:MAG: hypothetical protein IJ290_07490 [Bacteroidaceae bacterium]|nr:hypothetical protein [Bacteroidaceae bacterium]